MNSCISCDYWIDDECKFFEKEEALAESGIDCIETYYELLEDMQ